MVKRIQPLQPTTPTYPLVAAPTYRIPVHEPVCISWNTSVLRFIGWLLLGIALFCGCGETKSEQNQPKEYIIIKGSECMKPAFEYLAMMYEFYNGESIYPFKVIGGGSERGIGALIDGRGAADLIISSRRLTFDDLAMIRRFHPDRSIRDIYHSIPYGNDSIFFIVNEANPIASMHRRNIIKIFLKKVKYWSEIYPQTIFQDKDNEILPVSRETNAGIYAIIHSAMFSLARFHKDVVELSNDEQIIEYVTQHKNAIGFISKASYIHYYTHVITEPTQLVVPITINNLFDPTKSTTYAEKLIEKPLLEKEEAKVPISTDTADSTAETPVSVSKTGGVSGSLAAESMHSIPGDTLIQDNIQAVRRKHAEMLEEYVPKAIFAEEDKDEGFYLFTMNPLDHTCYIYRPIIVEPPKKESTVEKLKQLNPTEKEEPTPTKKEIVDAFISFIYEEGLEITAEYGFHPIPLHEYK